MSQEKNEEMRDREQILALAEAYCKKYLNTGHTFHEGDRINYGGRVFNENEMRYLIDSCLDFWLTDGRYCAAFEQKLGKILGCRYVSVVNSGSSANLLAFMALTAPELGERRIRRGDEVITVACAFPTTISPIIQFGAVPVFLDVRIPTYNIQTDDLEKAVSPRTKAVIIAHTLGNPFNIKEVKSFCEKHRLWLIEDNCDALGSEYTLEGVTKKTGTWGDIGTSSFYPPHHITMGEGGAVYTNNPVLHRLVRSFRDWGRECICSSGNDNMCGRRFSGQFGELPVGYDHKYVYSHFGYNLKITEMQAAIGCAQIEKLDDFTAVRRSNFNYLHEALLPLEDRIILPEPELNSKPSWFGFIITVRGEEDRGNLVRYIESHNIQTRALFAGNIIKHPCMNEFRDTDAYRVVGSLANTNIVLNKTFWIGVYPGMTKEKLDYMIKVIISFFK